MIRLPNTGTYSLELVTAQNGANVVVCYSDATSTTYIGGTQTSNVTSATTTTICSVPAASTVRDVDQINIKNTYAGSHSITVQVDASSTNVPLVSAVLLENESLNYTHGAGWQALAADGTTKSASLSIMTSAQFAAIISDETGTAGSVVFSNTPTLVTPILGTPTSGTLTNCTGLPAAGVTGTALVTAAIGTTVQAYDADLTTWAGVTPGTGVGTALAANVGTAGSFAVVSSIQTQSYTKFTAGGTADAITGALSPVIGAYATGMRITTTPAGANTITAPTINLSSLGTKKIFKRDSTGSAVALAAGDYNASGPFDFEYLASLDSAAGGWVLLNPLPGTSSTTVPVRQTVLSGPVDSSGFAAFVGSTGSTTVTATGTLKATAAAGGDANYTGSITNPSWTSLVTSATVTTPIASPGLVNWTGHPMQVGEPVVFSGGTLPTGIVAGTTYYVIAAGLTANVFEIAATIGGTAINFTGTSSGTQTCCAQTTYMYLDITSGGTVTTGSTPHAPVYQFGGTYSTVDKINTFNIQEMTMKAGNGATASQVYRVFVGEVAIVTALVNSIVWYQLMGRYESAWTATLPVGVGVISFNHNIGINQLDAETIYECTTTDGIMAVGDQVRNVGQVSSTYMFPPTFQMARNVIKWHTGVSGHNYQTAASFTILTAASWKYKIFAQRGW